MKGSMAAFLITLAIKLELILGLNALAVATYKPLSSLIWLASILVSWRFTEFRRESIRITIELDPLTTNRVIAVALVFASMTEEVFGNNRLAGLLSAASMVAYFFWDTISKLGRKLGAKLLASSGLTSVNAASFRREVQQSA